MSQKIKIEKNTVQETLVMPLYGKAWCVKNYPDLFHDRDCQKIMEQLDYDFSAMRASGIDVSTNFALDDPVRELKSWSDRFASVKSNRMFQDYMKPDKRFGLLYRLMTKFSDANGMSQLDVIEFA